MKIQNILPIFFLLLVVSAIGIMFPHFMGSIDSNADIVNTQYEEQYDDITDNSITAMAIMSLVGIFFAIAILVVGVKVFTGYL